jgi:phosphohistidine phosphatase
MKKLFLVRHAKSSWEEPGVSDIDRPLIPKGIRKTGLVIEYLKKQGVEIDLMVSSPAVRAHETAKIMAVGLDYPVNKIRIERKIYDGYYDRIIDIIYGTPNEVVNLMIFGHNPTMTNLANLFLHPGIDNMPTSCVVCISFNTEKWEEIPNSESNCEFVAFPKMLK